MGAEANRDLLWLLGGTLLPQVPGHPHRYRFGDTACRALIDHGCIALFELPNRRN